MSADPKERGKNIFKAKPDPDAVQCPNCEEMVTSLNKIEAGLRLRLTRENVADIPNECCANCFANFERMVSRGAKLRAEKAAKEQGRVLLWKNRLSLLKQARQFHSQRLYAEAISSYEKYLKVLEVVYDVPEDGLKPELFQDRPSEITAVASTYWDLMRAYDQFPKYADRQIKTAKKLSEFVRFTPAFANIMRRAEMMARQGKNRDAFKTFLRLSEKERPRCFIATSAFEGLRTEPVEILCLFRDQILRPRRYGRALITLYYRRSPAMAAWLDRNAWLKPAMRHLLAGLARRLKKTFDLKRL